MRGETSPRKVHLAVLQSAFKRLLSKPAFIYLFIYLKEGQKLLKASQANLSAKIL